MSTGSGKQVKQGKALEYSLLKSLEAFVSRHGTCEVIKNSAYHVAKDFYQHLDINLKESMDYATNLFPSVLAKIEPNLHNNDFEKLILSLSDDARGQEGDVRDVVISSGNLWEIGISCKNNHKAVKHPRLSGKLDFGNVWLGRPVSSNYWSKIHPIFDRLRTIKAVSPSTKWADIGDVHSDVYYPILDAFMSELKEIYQSDKELISQKLIRYLIGNLDFYKFINLKNQVDIQAINFNKTLNTASSIQAPDQKLSKVRLPSKLVNMEFKKDSKSTLFAYFDEGWTISFRIHSASSRVEPSLKFDINLVGIPENYFRTVILK